MSMGAENLFSADYLCIELGFCDIRCQVVVTNEDALVEEHKCSHH